MQDTRPLLLESDFPPLVRQGVDTLQVNLGYRCNLSCVHCHVNAGPTRTEMMSAETIELVLEVAREYAVHTLDITGGSCISCVKHIRIRLGNINTYPHSPMCENVACIPSLAPLKSKRMRSKRSPPSFAGKCGVNSCRREKKRCLQKLCLT